MRLKTVPALLLPNNSWVYPRKETAVISLGPISGQKYLQQGYNFTAGAVGAALSDLLLLCIKLSERSVQSNVLTRSARPRNSHRLFPLVESGRQPLRLYIHFHQRAASVSIYPGVNNWCEDIIINYIKCVAGVRSE